MPEAQDSKGPLSNIEKLFNVTAKLSDENARLRETNNYLLEKCLKLKEAIKFLGELGDMGFKREGKTNDKINEILKD